MEKLIELLNEFINKTIFPYDRGAKCIWYENHLFLFETWTDVLEDTVISARYGFIEWLVENGRIDLDKVKPLSVFQETWYYNKYESLLMILSIQDEPINFLISILK